MMDTGEGVTLEEELLGMEDNREINPDHDLKDKEKCSEARKQDKQPARATERQPKETHQRYPPKSGLKTPKRQ